MTLDRREMLFGRKDAEQGAGQKDTALEKNAGGWDRRKFLMALASLGAVSLSGSQEVRAPESPAAESQAEKGQAYSETTVQAGLLFLANTATEELFNPYIKKHYGVQLGNMRSDELKEMLESKPFQTYFTNVFEAPLGEEVLFRLLPAAILGWAKGVGHMRGTGALAWDVGVPMAAIFALAHNVDTKKGIDTRHVPLSQFVGGLFLWQLMRTQGIDHAILAHSAYNLAYTRVALPLYQTFPN